MEDAVLLGFAGAMLGGGTWTFACWIHLFIHLNQFNPFEVRAPADYVLAFQRVVVLDNDDRLQGSRLNKHMLSYQ